MSNGSAVVFAMACRGVYPFRAYGGVAATFYDQAACGDAPPTSFIYFHGTGDEVVPYQGGETPIFPVRAVQRVLGDWAGHDGCAREPRRQDVASDVVRETWRGCSKGSRLQAYVIDDGGHTWPGAGFEVPVLGKTTSSIDATRLMADFFGLKAP
jgi:polyhydroxybutyrate depolymerase